MLTDFPRMVGCPEFWDVLIIVCGVPEETLYMLFSAVGSSNTAAAAPDQESGDDDELLPLSALGQAVLLHPFAVKQLMAR